MDSAETPVGWRSRSRWLVLLVGWSLFGALQGLVELALATDTERAWIRLVAFHLPLALAWAALTPVIGRWRRSVDARFPGSPAMRVLAHLPLLLAAAVAHTWLRRALILAAGTPLTISFDVTLLYFADLTVVSYLAALWASRVLDASSALLANERRAIALRQQLLDAQMEYLELQLRPHFLFNALSTIAELAHEAPKAAARMLQNVSALLESAVTRDGRRLVSLEEELDALRPYLDIQRLRFADWLVIEEEIDDAARQALVPRFVLQPLVENAVHHGLIGRSARGLIAIRANVSAERLRLEVVDNGVGLQAPTDYRQGRGLGLANLRARLETVYGGNATLELHGENGAGASGTAARLDLPLMPAGRPHGIAADDDDAIDEASVRPTDGITRWTAAHPWLALVAVWTAVGVLRAQHSYAYLMLRDRFTTEAMMSALRFDAAVAVVWFALSIVVLWLGRRVPFGERRVVTTVAVHVVAAVAIAYTHGVLSRLLGVGITDGSWLAFPSELFAWNVVAYAIMLAVTQARELERWIREREMQVEHLRKELREARFRQVMLELRPRVLLETLRHLQALVTESPARAERVLADIGDFLRSTLNGIHAQAVTLREESDTVRAYARVLGVASVPDLTLHMSIAVDLLDEPVPNGALRLALDSVVDARGNDRRGAVIHLDASPTPEGIVITATARSGGTASSWSARITGSPPELAREAA